MAYPSGQLKAGDIVRMRKKHPCGGTEFRIISCGMDFHLRCEKCGSPIKLSRVKIEKTVTACLSENNDH